MKKPKKSAKAAAKLQPSAKTALRTLYGSLSAKGVKTSKLQQKAVVARERAKKFSSYR